MPTAEAPRGSSQFKALLSQTSSPRKSLTSTNSTPLRSSRAKGLVNLSHYESIERTVTETDGTTTSEEFSIGDAVFLDPQAAKRVGHQPLLIGFKSAKSPSKKSAKGKSKSNDAREAIDDGLNENAMIGLIIDIFENEREQPMIKVHWLYRPKLALATWVEGALEKLNTTIDNVGVNKLPIYVLELNDTIYRENSSIP